MKKILIIAPVLFACISIIAQTGSINNILVEQRYDDTGLVDIQFDLSGNGTSYDINLEVSFDGGTDFNPISASHLNGDLNSVSPGTNKHVIWDGAASYPDTFSDKVNVKIIAIESVTSGLSEGLICYYPFNGNANDESGNGNHGTEMNGATYSTDRFGNSNSALSLDGVDDYIKKNAENINRYFSISAWIYLDDLSIEQFIYSERCNWGTDNNGTRSRVLLWRTPDQNSTYPNKFNFLIRTNAGNWNDNDAYRLSTVNSFTGTGWVHVVAIRDNQTLKLFLNGIEQETEGINPVGILTNNYDLRDPYNNEGYVGSHYYGDLSTPSGVKISRVTMDDLRIYNFALSASEVNVLFKEKGWQTDNESGTFIDLRDSKTYKWVKIGNQTWMAENLKYSSLESFCYNNNPLNEALYGRLYPWIVAKNSCPTGWHLPSDNEWKELEVSLGMSQSEADIDGSYRGTDEGGMLKAVDNLWIEPNVGANNSSRFSALPGGCGWQQGNFVQIGTSAWFWTSNEENSSNGWCRALSNNNSKIARGGTLKGCGMSVRCIKDWVLTDDD